MELGSAEHKQLLQRSILKISIKVATLGLVLGVALMIPSFLRENTFSTGLFYAGSAIVVGSLLYAVGLGIKKHRQLIKPLQTSKE